MGNLLRMQMLRDADAKFVGYQLPHPLMHVCHMKVQTASASSPVACFKNAVDDLSSEVELMDRGFRAEIERAKRPAAAAMETS